jgi:predicted dehydrogenase
MLRVYGSKGTAELYFDHAIYRTGRGKETRFDAKVTSFVAQFSHFADVVKKGAAVAYTPEQALLDLQLMEAIVR